MGKIQLAAIQPMVPQTRTLGNCRSRSSRLANAIELESARVGMYTTL
jgi:hypothetical protein